MNTLSMGRVCLSIVAVLIVAGCGDDVVGDCPVGFVRAGDGCEAAPSDAGGDTRSEDVGSDAAADVPVDVAELGLTVSAEPVLLLEQGEDGEVRVEVDRLGGFDGEVRITVTDLPVGVVAESFVIPADESVGDLSMITSPTASQGGPLQISLTAQSESGTLEASTSFGLVIRGASGSPDLSFGTRGEVEFTPRDDAEAYASMNVQCDSQGRVLVFGVIQGDLDWSGYLARFGQDGAIDESFGEGGVLDDWGRPQASVSSLLIDGDRILVAAHTWTDGGDQTGYLRALSADGAVDPTFGVGGDVVLPDGSRKLLQRSGGYLVVGRGFSPGLITEVFRDGGLSEFTTTDLTPVSPFSVAVDPMDRVLLGGWSRTADALPEFGRMTASGNIDVAFGTDGYAQVPFLVGSEYAGVYSIVAGPDGGGYGLANIGSVAIGEKTIALFRIDENGTADPDWGFVGWTLVAENTEGGSLIRRQDGQLLVTFFRDGMRYVSQFTTEGRPDTSFGVDGTIELDRRYNYYGYEPVGERLVAVGANRADTRQAVVRRIWL